MSNIRLLVLFQGKVIDDHPGYHDGFKRLKNEGALEEYIAIPYFGYAEKNGWDELWIEVEKNVRERNINAVFLHFFHSFIIPNPTSFIKRIQSCPSHPIIFTSLGDPFSTILNSVPNSYKYSSRLADINFMTSMGKLANGLALGGTKNMVLMPHGVCQKRFVLPLNIEKYNPDFDVVFIGSRMRSRNLFGSSSWHGFWRDHFVNKLTKLFGSRFGLFGNHWEGNPSWHGPLSYSKQHEIARRSRVQVGGYPNSQNDYYTSDREFIALASGIPFVDYFVPGVECIFEDGKEWWLGRTFDEMQQHIEKLLILSDEKRIEIGSQVSKVILDNHTQYHRCKLMVDIVSHYRYKKLAGKKADVPVLPFLRFKLSSFSGYCKPIINWQG